MSIAFVAGNNLTSPCGSIQYLAFAIPSSLILCLALLLILLLILYPFKWFRECCCFSKCRFLKRTSVNIFIEKFHSCYRNGLDGGRDMRSFSGLYFALRILLPLFFITHRFLPESVELRRHPVFICRNTHCACSTIQENIYECFGYTIIITSCHELSSVINIIKLFSYSRYRSIHYQLNTWCNILALSCIQVCLQAMEKTRILLSYIDNKNEEV